MQIIINFGKTQERYHQGRRLTLPTDGITNRKGVTDFVEAGTALISYTHGTRPQAWSGCMVPLTDRAPPGFARRAKTVTLVGDGAHVSCMGPLPTESVRREVHGLCCPGMSARQRPSAGVPASHARIHLPTSRRLKSIKQPIRVFFASRDVPKGQGGS